MVGAGGVLGHYRIVERLGQGGMGVVFRAHDLRLGRDVALKILQGAIHDEVSRKRFHHEARLLAKLNHPNIATIYDFDSQDGIDFLVAEYIPGQTLSARLASGPLPERELVRLGIQLAEGLACAHGAGVLHRDLKPGNLQLTPDGRLKILDFGLAQFSHPTSVATTQSVLDLPHAGTLPYQAPEQLRGKGASVLSDIYAAGAVLYEAVTGQRAFDGKDPVQVIQRITQEPPNSPRQLNPALSQAAEEVILRCLEKDPAKRPQSAVELSTSLLRLYQPGSTVLLPQVATPRKIWRGIGIAVVALTVLVLGLVGGRRLLNSPAPTPVQTIQSIAVLPLENFSGDPKQEYFADGMTEELITDLAQISALRVISRTSVMTYKNSKKSLPAIARELGVDAVVEGSVQRSQHKVRINAQLIQAQGDRHLWAKSYEQEISDVLSLQESVARAIADEVKIKLTAEELRSLSRPRQVNPEAHENYLLGLYYWNQRTREGSIRSIDYLEKAVALDSRNAAAYAALADAYHSLPEFAGTPSKTAFEKARFAATRAVQLDPSLAEGHASLAKLKEDADWDWAGAEDEYKKAMQLNPGLGVIHSWYSNLLAETARFPEAILQARAAEKVDPKSSFASSNLSFILYLAGQYGEALDYAQRALQIDSSSTRAHRTLGCIYLAQQHYDQAISEFQNAEQLSPGSPEYVADLGYTYGISGNKRAARDVLRSLEASRQHGSASSYSLAVVQAGLGNEREVLELLRNAVQERAAGISQLKVAPFFSSVRANTEFKALLRQAGLAS